MAGAYMDPPEERLAYDRDGSVVSVISLTGDIYAASLSLKQQLNAEADGTTVFFPVSANRVAVIFPLKMDLKAIFWASSASSYKWHVETSKDTTNGLDGTWAKQLSDQSVASRVKPDYRDESFVKLLPATSGSQDVRGIRLIPNPSSNTFNTLNALHLYGYPSSLATTDRLALWHPTVDQRLPAGWFDWGNTPRSSSADRTFRIKNLSSARVAVDVDVYIEALTPGNPSVVGMHTLSMDGGNTFQGALNLPQLNAGQISPLLILRRAVPANAMLSTWSARLAADVDRWS